MEMPLHCGASFGGASSTDSAIDFSMRFKGGFSISCTFSRRAAFVVESCSDGLHQGGEDGVPGSLADGAVKSHIVNQVLSGIVNCGVHFSHFFRELRQVLLFSALGGQCSKIGFE